MTSEIRNFVDPSIDLLGLGEPTHRDPTFGRIRNELFAQLTELGFRSIALETDRVAALAVNDFVHQGVGTLDTAMNEGFSHGFGAFDPNRHLVAWMREHNEGRSAAEQLTFHGFDATLEFTAASPRRDLEHARDFLGLDLALTDLVGEDEQWSRTEAVMDPAESPGDTPEAARLRAIADDMLSLLYAEAPTLIAKTSRAAWYRARTHLTSALGLLRYHRQAAQRIDDAERWSRLSATRDALMARNLLDIRDIEADRGPTLVFAHNLHLQRNQSRMSMANMDLSWHSAGAISASLLGERYSCIVGSLGRSEGIGLGEPDPDTFEGRLQARFASWGLITTGAVEPAPARADATPEQGYFPLDRAILQGADLLLHVSEGATTSNPWPSPDTTGDDESRPEATAS